MKLFGSSRDLWGHLLSILVFVVSYYRVSSYEVLILCPFATHGHKHFFDALADNLAKKGHQVTHMTCVNSSTGVNGVRDIYLDAFDRIFAHINFFEGNIDDANFRNYFYTSMMQLVKESYQSAEFQDILRNSKHSRPYDLMLLDGVYSEFTLPLAYVMDIPVILASPTHLTPHSSWNLDIPRPLSFVPAYFFPFQDPMTFWQRFVNVYYTMMIIYERNHILVPKMEAVIQDFLPNMPSLLALEKNISFVMANTHPSFYTKYPTMPYFVEVGGLHCKPGKKLPKDLDEFLRNSGDAGSIFFSLGSTVSAKYMPEEMKVKLVNAFSRLNQNVLWKFDEQLTNISKNVKIVKWVPQSDILAHENLRLFITHGGSLSLQEAVYNACPLLGIPLSVDQWGNVGMVIRHGIGEALDWKTFTSDELYDKIQKIVTESEYKKNALKLSELWKDRPQSPGDLAAYWIDYVIRHKGARHLRTHAGLLNVFQYFLLDIAAVVIGLGIFIVVIAFMAFRYVSRWRRQRSIEKQYLQSKKN